MRIQIFKMPKPDSIQTSETLGHDFQKLKRLKLKILATIVIEIEL